MGRLLLLAALCALPACTGNPPADGGDAPRAAGDGAGAGAPEADPRPQREQDLERIGREAEAGAEPAPGQPR